MIIEPYSEKYFLGVRNLRNSDEVGVVSNRYRVDALVLFEELLSFDYRVALVDGVVVGYIGVRGVDNEVSVAVKPSFYRQGIASRLLEDVVKDYDSLSAVIHVGNERSEALFSKFGFVPLRVVYGRGG